MEVFSPVAVALDDCHHVHLGELRLEVLETEDGLVEALPGDGEGVLLGVDVRDGAVVSDKVFPLRSDPAVSEVGQLALRVVGVHGVGQQVWVGRGVVLVDGAVVHRVLSDHLHVGWADLPNLVPGHVLHDVAPVVLGVHTPVDLQVIPSSHLKPAHSPRVPREVCHVVQTSLKHKNCNSKLKGRLT